nr:MAG TPA: hypothetical protein [Caudoviricetes sp.]
MSSLVSIWISPFCLAGGPPPPLLTLLVYRRDVRTSNLCDKKWCTSRCCEKPQRYPHTTAITIVYLFRAVWLKEWLKTSSSAPVARAETFETETASVRESRWDRRENSLTNLATFG